MIVAWMLLVGIAAISAIAIVGLAVEHYRRKPFDGVTGWDRFREVMGHGPRTP